MMNPSTADAEVDDATVRRCRSFARREGAPTEAADIAPAAFIVGPYRYTLHRDGFSVVNPYAMRATDPCRLVEGQRSGVDIIGPENDALIAQEAALADLIIVACGNPPAGLVGFAERMRAVARLLSGDGERDLWCFGVTKAGWPRHPLYLPGEAPLERWQGPR